MSTSETIGKPDLIDHIAKEAGLTKGAATKATEAVLSFFAGALDRGDTVQFRGIMTISSKETAEREGRNPRTGEKVTIPAGRRYKLKVSKGFGED